MKPLVFDLFCGVAYLVTCIPNGKRYIGITHRGVKRRWYEHTADAGTRPGQSVLRHAIAKYGPCQFTVEELCYARTHADLIATEIALIKQWGTMVPNGYNLTAGGEGANGCVRSAEHRAAISRSRLGKPRSAITKAKLSAAKIGISQNVGESNGGAKLTVNQVREARRRISEGESQRSIARSLGIHWNAIWKIAHGIKWRSVV